MKPTTPTLEENQLYATVEVTKGNYLYDCITTSQNNAEAQNLTVLCYLPKQFHKKMWIRKGTLVVIELYDDDNKNKIDAEIVQVIYDKKEISALNDSESESEEDDLFVNRNRYCSDSD